MPNMDVLIALGAGVSVLTGAWAVLHVLGLAPMIMNFAPVGAMIASIHLTGTLRRGESPRPLFLRDPGPAVARGSDGPHRTRGRRTRGADGGTCAWATS